MTQEHAQGHAGHNVVDTGERPYFPESQWKQFERDDIAAGKAIIVLMSGIFSIGLVLYSIIAIITGAGQ